MKFKTLLSVLTIIIILTGAAYAQAPEKQEEKSKPLAPLLLTREQLERLADAEKTRQLARAQLEAAQNLMDKIAAQIDGLIKEFQIELRLDPAKYERDLRVIDQQKNAYGFLPKAEPKAEPKK